MLQQNKQPKFKVGDVVEVSAQCRYLPKGKKLGKITRIEKYRKTDFEDYELQNFPDGEFYVYSFGWSERPEQEDSAIESWLRLCKGIKNRKLCSGCWCYEFCPKSPLNCKTGGKLDVKRCIECNNRFKCWTT